MKSPDGRLTNIGKFGNGVSEPEEALENLKSKKAGRVGRKKLL